MLLAAFIAIVGTGTLDAPVHPAPAPRTALVRAPQPHTGSTHDGVIVLTAFAPSVPATVLTPDGKVVLEVPVGAAASPINPGDRPVCPLLGGRLSPDGKHLAAFKLGPIPQGNDGPWTPMHLWLFDLESKEGPGEALKADVRNPSVAWAAGSTKIYVSQVDPKKAADPRENGKPPPMISWEYDFKTKKQTPLALPAGHAVADASADGRTLLTVVYDAFDPQTTRSFIVPVETLKPRALTETAFRGMRISPDGKAVIGCRYAKLGDKAPLLSVVLVADQTESKIPVPAKATHVQSACWSPDGKRIAYLWTEEVAAPQRAGAAPVKVFASRVTVADADGGNAKAIVRSEQNTSIKGVDWK